MSLFWNFLHSSVMYDYVTITYNIISTPNPKSKN